MQYAQKEVVPGTDGKTRENVRCFYCNKFGHIKTYCPEVPDNKKDKDDEGKTPQDTGQQNMQVGFESDDEQLVDFQSMSGMQCHQTHQIQQASVQVQHTNVTGTIIYI